MTIGGECRWAEQACKEIDPGDSAFADRNNAMMLGSV